MALGDITDAAVLAAMAEFDRLGRDAFLRRYKFAASRRYRIRHDGKLYDSKPIMGVAHGYLPGRTWLRASEFSGGVDHVGPVLEHLGFEMVTDEPATERSVDGEGSGGTLAPSSLDAWAQAVSRLRPALVAGKPMLKQAVVLLWAVGRARRGAPRLLDWHETLAELAPLLEKYRREGERRQGRPDYPIAALSHVGLWVLPGHEEDVPAAHGDSRLRNWFTDNAPRGGLPHSMYVLARGSGEGRIRIIDAVIDRFFDEFDYRDLLAAVGLYDDDIAADELPPSRDHDGYPLLSGQDDPADDPRAAYARWCDLVTRREAETYGKRRLSISNDPIRLAPARRAVLLRSQGRCENPQCRREAPDVTDRGDPVLEIDHVEQIADLGRDHPLQMIALCPNCHAVKTRGTTRDHLRSVLAKAARENHHRWFDRNNTDLLDA